MHYDNDYAQPSSDEFYQLKNKVRQLQAEVDHLTIFNAQLLDICIGWNDLHENWPEGAWPGKAMLLLDMTRTAIRRADEEYKR